MTGSEPKSDEERPPPALGRGAVEEVTRRAERMAESRSGDTIGTADVLFAILDIYGGLFDRALYLRGTSREELLERLGKVPEKPSRS
jgi:hypothetical protein